MGTDLGTGKGRRVHWRLFVTACALLALTLSAALASAEGEEGKVPEAREMPIWLQEAIGASPALEDAARQAEARDAHAPDPASRTEFRSLDATEARALAREEFPEIVAEPVELGLKLSPGERLLRYVAPNVAQLKLADGERAVAQSALPMLSEAPSGDLAPVDLSLRQGEGGIEPANPLVELRIPTQLERGIELPGAAGLTLTPTGPSGAPLASAEVQVEGATALYANTQADADTLVKPLPLGFETHTILRSPAAPESLYFDLSADGEVSLVQQEDGSASVETDGREIASIAAPSAIDAAGRPVPISTRVEGDRLALDIEHGNANYEYPIAVDPTVNDVNSFKQVWPTEDPKGNWANWPPASGYWESGCECLRLYMPNAEYGVGYAWGYATQGASRIYQFDANVTSPAPATLTNIIGIVNTSSAWEASLNLGTGLSSAPATVCAAVACASSGGSNGNAAIYELVGVANAPSQYGQGDLNSATVRIAQDTGPTVTFDTTSKEIGGKKNALYNSQWVKDEQAVVRYTATDPGIGVYERKLYAGGAGGWSKEWSQVPLENCNGVQCEPSYTETKETKTLPDGIHTIEGGAKNATGASHVATAQVKVDETVPFASVEGLPEDGTIASGRALPLKFKVGDGTAPTASSGVKAGATEIKLDGSTVASKATTKGCSPGPCEAIAAESGLEPGVGYHVLSMKVEDNAGNVSETSFPFVVQSGASEDIGPGKVSLTDGEFTMISEDVSAAVAGAGLSVTRTYQSKHLNLGSSTSSIWLDKSWQLSLGGWRGITLLPGGDAVLSDPRGRPFVFDDKGAATPMGTPPGYEGWTLTYSGEGAGLAFELTNPSGDITVFERPEGKGDLFVPTSFAGSGGSEETIFEFQSTSSGPRPVQVIGPTPPGVECEPELVRGCRALTFDYAGSTTASGTDPDDWGDVKDRLKSIDLHAWDPQSEEMAAITLVEYAYDKHGRLRATWDPRVSPALKTTYAYGDDVYGPSFSYWVTAVTPPGQQPWILEGGADGDLGKLLSVSRPDPTIAESTEELIPLGLQRIRERPEVHHALTVDPGQWSGNPLTFHYLWEACNGKGAECAIRSHGPTYTPDYGDSGKRLRVRVTAVNGNDATSAYTGVTSKVNWGPNYGRSCKFSAWENEEGLEPELHLTSTALSPDGRYFYALDQFNDRVIMFETVKPNAEGATPANCFKRVLGSFGSSGSGSGQFDEPTDIDVSSAGVVYVVDKGNDRVQVFSAEGEFEDEFGSDGISPLNGPMGIDISGNEVLVADPGSDAIQVFNLEGVRQSVRTQFWVPIGGGQYSPQNITDPIDVVRGWENKIFVAYAGGLVEIGSGWQVGTVKDLELPGSHPYRLAFDGVRVYVADVLYGRVLYLYSSGEMGEFGKEGQLGLAVGLSVNAELDELYVTDFQSGMVLMVKEYAGEPDCRSAYEQNWSYLYEEGTCAWEVPGEPTGPEELAVTKVDYDVPLSGEGVPTMTAAAVAEWGQKKIPAYATAILPPGVALGEYERAPIFYMDGAGRVINTAMPGGRIETNEYDKHENLIRNLTPANRERALAVGGGAEATAARARELDTQNIYDPTGARLLKVLGPEREIVLNNGTQVELRPQTDFEYTSSGGSKPLVTKQTESAQGWDPRVTTYGYGGQEGLGWELEAPTSVTVGPGLETRTVYDPKSGAVLEQTKPADPDGGGPSAERTIYYSAGESAIEECGERPEWHGLPCRAEPAAQPETEGLPQLAVTTTTYDIYNQPLTTTEVVGEETRQTSIDYDEGGRLVGASITSSEGVPMPTVETEYDEETGLTVAVHNETEYLLSEYDSLGRLTSYTDADGVTSTYTYDDLGRLQEVYDGKATRTHSYHPTTGDLVGVTDSGVGTFSATYDADGRLLTETAPGGLKAGYSYDPSGAVDSLAYTKTTKCTEDCTWYSEQAERSVFGQVRERSSTLGEFTYAYDTAGRLTLVKDTEAGQCTTRAYSFDPNTNRTKLVTRPPGEGGSCDTQSQGTAETYSYDAADRLVGEGVSYEPFGSITELPAALSGGSALSASYYVDGSAATISQDGLAVAFGLDPLGRQRSVETSGEAPSERISHFSGPGDSPSWSAEGEAWTRYVGGIGGGLAAIATSGGATTLQVSNLHGDVVATVAADDEATGLDFVAEATEYGVPQGEDPPARYSWLGAAQRSTDLPSGVISMGARTYVPTIGRFLQTDPIPGGGPNAYAYTWGDPVNQTDLSGERTPTFPTWLREAMGRSPAMPPPPPPPVVEAEEEVEVAITGSRARKGKMRRLIGTSKFPQIPCPLCVVSKKIGEVTVSGGKYLYKKVKNALKTASKSEMVNRAVGWARSGIEFKTGLRALSPNPKQREQFFELMDCAKGAIENFVEVSSVWKQGMKVAWVSEGCIESVLQGW